jgi:hypothetical protein
MQTLAPAAHLPWSSTEYITRSTIPIISAKEKGRSENATIPTLKVIVP